VTPELRWRGHLIALRAQKHINKYLQRAWNKYGECNFEFSIIEQIDEGLLEREQYWLDNTKCYDKRIGFNIAKIAGQPFHDGMGEDAAIARLNVIIGKFGTIANLPKRNNPNDTDRGHSLWIYSMRRAKSKKGSNVWYPILDSIADNSGLAVCLIAKKLWPSNG
jgi:hypothetical protein